MHALPSTPKTLSASEIHALIQRLGLLEGIAKLRFDFPTHAFVLRFDYEREHNYTPLAITTDVFSSQETSLSHPRSLTSLLGYEVTWEIWTSLFSLKDRLPAELFFEQRRLWLIGQGYRKRFHELKYEKILGFLNRWLVEKVADVVWTIQKDRTQLFLSQFLTSPLLRDVISISSEKTKHTQDEKIKKTRDCLGEHPSTKTFPDAFPNVPSPFLQSWWQECPSPSFFGSLDTCSLILEYIAWVHYQSCRSQTTRASWLWCFRRVFLLLLPRKHQHASYHLRMEENIPSIVGSSSPWTWKLGHSKISEMSLGRRAMDDQRHFHILLETTDQALFKLFELETVWRELLLWLGRGLLAENNLSLQFNVSYTGQPFAFRCGAAWLAKTSTLAASQRQGLS